mmetsp:Transcript_43838/g.44316  ORF Transcript_43838/g.44316 Transcript_43838/m.44316 type:complete len:129 (-) Transcript_43838:53-439(-)
MSLETFNRSTSASLMLYGGLKSVSVRVDGAFASRVKKQTFRLASRDVVRWWRCNESDVGNDSSWELLVRPDALIWFVAVSKLVLPPDIGWLCKIGRLLLLSCSLIFPHAFHFAYSVQFFRCHNFTITK